MPYVPETELADLREEVARLRETVRWMAQTVHQAHHEGPIETCPKGVCVEADTRLAKVKP